MDVAELVRAELKKRGASEATLRLWNDLVAAYDDGGPTSVKELLQDQVKESRKRATKEIREVRRVVAVAAKPKRRGKR